MIRKIVFFCLIFLILLISCNHLYGYEVVDEINTLLSREKYHEGLKLINKGLSRTEDLSPEENALLLQSKARFYHEFAGDVKRAADIYKKTYTLGLPVSSPILKDSRENIRSLRDYLVKYKKNYELFRCIRRDVRDKSSIFQQVERLKMIIEGTEDSTQQALAHYYLGNVYSALEKNLKAYRAYKTALRYKPCLGYHLAAVAFKDKSYKEWIEGLLKGLTWFVLGLTGLLIIAIMISSRPWRWLTLKKVGVFFAATSVISILVLFVLFLMTRVFSPSGAAYYGEPVFVNTSFGGFGFEILKTFFIYVFIGLFASSVPALCTIRFRHVMTWRSINIIISMILFISLMMNFYLEYKENLSDYSLQFFSKDETHRFSYFSGDSYYLIKDVRPFVLTDPKTYQGLNIDKMNEPVFRKWLEDQYTIIQANKGEIH